MRQVEVIGIVLGVLGFMLGSYNLWRGIRITRDARAIEYAQRKIEALMLVRDCESKYASIIRKLRALLNDAKERRLDDVIQLAEDAIAQTEDILKSFSSVQSAIEGLPTENAKHEELLRMVDVHIFNLLRATSPAEIENFESRTLDPVIRELRTDPQVLTRAS